MPGNTSKRYPPELKERAVRMVAEIRGEHDSEWAAMARVAELLGITSTESVRKWVRQGFSDRVRYRMDSQDLRAVQSLPAGLAMLASRREPFVLKQGIVDMALAAVQGCEWASLTQLRGATLETAASTDLVVERADAAQYRLREGPSLDALCAEDSYHVRDTSSETRWPRWSRAAHRLGVGSVVTVRLAAPARRVGALNCYASRADAFGDEEIQAAHLFAAQAAVAIVRLNDLGDLERGMRTRHIIEIAQGILMADDRQLTPSDAFRVLRDTAHHQHVGLRDFAELVVEARRPALPLRRRTGGWALG